MQTFLPSASFFITATYLDRARLGKQRIEAKQLVQAIIQEEGGWVNHPAAIMWKGHVAYLALYGKAMCEEWVRRGYEDNQWGFFDVIVQSFPEQLECPWWYIDEAALNKLTSSHRAALLHKDPEWYGQWGWSEKPLLNYYWPGRSKSG